MTEIASPELSEDCLALEFTAHYGRDLRFVAIWGRWLQWKDAVHWKFEDTLAAFDLARIIVRRHAVDLARANDDSRAIRLATAKTVAAIEHLARADRHHAEIVDRWDGDQWFLSSPMTE
jgi:putative DNA primase/helicase